MNPSNMNAKYPHHCLAFILTAASVVFSSNCYALNPIIQTIYTADPAPMVHDGPPHLRLIGCGERRVAMVSA